MKGWLLHMYIHVLIVLSVLTGVVAWLALRRVRRKARAQRFRSTECSTGGLEPNGGSAELRFIRESLEKWMAERMVSRDVFETVLGLHTQRADQEGLGRDTFYEILRNVPPTSTHEGVWGAQFFLNLVRRSVLGGRYEEIVLDRGDCVEAHSIAGGTYVRLLCGLAGVICGEMRVSGATATIYDSADRRRGDYGSREAVYTTSAIFKIRLRSSEAGSAISRDLLLAVAWFSRRMNVLSLDVGGLVLSAGAVDVISGMLLNELEMARCGISGGILAALVAEGSSLKNTLVRLDVSFNDLRSIEDRGAIASLGPECLRIEGCSLETGELALMLENTDLGRSLRKLNVSENEVGEEDMRAISRTRIDELDITGFSIMEGYIAMLASRDSVLRDTLCKLAISSVCLSERDVVAISRLRRLEGLHVANCYIPVGGIPVLVGADLRGTLRTLNILNCALTYEDMAAIAAIPRLQALNLLDCNLPPGSLELLVQDGCSARDGVEKMTVSFNRQLTNNDVAAIAQMRSVRDLSMNSCGLGAEDIETLFGDEGSALGRGLRMLSLSGNSIGAREMGTLAKLGLDVLDISECGLAKESLAPLLASGMLRKTLQRLIISKNGLGEEDLRELFAMESLSVVIN